MSETLPIIRLTPCPKGYTKDLDKAVSPAQTIAHVRERLAAVNLDILAETRRVDVGRLGIPVYLSVCGADAREIMPTRKQMGKGSSPEQAQASALMELMERFAFFSFWQERPHMIRATWSEAEARFGVFPAFHSTGIPANTFASCASALAPSPETSSHHGMGRPLCRRMRTYSPSVPMRR